MKDIFIATEVNELPDDLQREYCNCANCKMGTRSTFMLIRDNDKESFEIKMFRMGCNTISLYIGQCNIRYIQADQLMNEVNKCHMLQYKTNEVINLVNNNTIYSGSSMYHINNSWLPLGKSC